MSSVSPVSRMPSRMPSYGSAPPPYHNEQSHSTTGEQDRSNSSTRPSTAPTFRQMPPRLRMANLSNQSLETRSTFPMPERDTTGVTSRLEALNLSTLSERSLQPQRPAPRPPRPPTPQSYISAAPPSFPRSPSNTSLPPLPSPESPPSGQVSKSRNRLNPFTAFRLGATRKATAQITEHAARQAAEHVKYENEATRQREVVAEAARRAANEAAKVEEEKTMRLVMAQEETKGHVRSHLQMFLGGEPPSEEELTAAFFTCAEACKAVGLDFPAVLQEPLIEGQPPVYWAILNRPMTHGTSRAVHDSLVFALLEASQPLNSTSLTAVRLACTTASDNTLLQRLFRHVPGLSPLSPSDAMLLAPLKESDVVEVMETRDGTGTFIAHIRILRFRLRMRVSRCVVVEFIASERIWTLKFAVTDQWILSLELGEQSRPVGIDADLFVEGSTSQALDSRDFDDPLLAISFGSTTADLWPGRENAITVRLDDTPMGPHLLNESSVLVDSKGTLCAQLNARLGRLTVPALVSDTASTVSPSSRSLETPFSEVSYPSSVKSAKAKTKKQKPPKEKRVYTSLRRGGHG